MIHYHGLPITPHTVALRAVQGGHAFVAHTHTTQLTLAMEVCQSFAVDNGAYSHWRAGAPKTQWDDYYEFVQHVIKVPNFDFAVIPDVIDGDEDANDVLLEEWPFGTTVGAPVWHPHESTGRLMDLATEYDRVCIGGSPEFPVVGNRAWWHRIAHAMDGIVDVDGYPVCKLHGLRMLNPKVFTKLPLASADSTNIGRNVGIDTAWRGTYPPPTKECRAQVMRERVEAHNAALRWDRSVLEE